MWVPQASADNAEAISRDETDAKVSHEFHNFDAAMHNASSEPHTIASITHTASIAAQATSEPEHDSYEDDVVTDMSERSESVGSLADGSHGIDLIHDADRAHEIAEDFDTEGEPDSEYSNDLECQPTEPFQTIGDTLFEDADSDLEQQTFGDTLFEHTDDDLDDIFTTEDCPGETTNPLELTCRSNITCWDDEALKSVAAPQEIGTQAFDEASTRPSTGSSVFERLHAEHAEKLRKSDLKRQERVLKLEEEWRELQNKCAKKIRCVPQPGEDPVWEKLFAKASAQQQKRVEEIERRESAQVQYMEKHSVHRNVDNVRGGSLFNRLHEAHQMKLEVLAKKRHDMNQNLLKEQKRVKGSSAFTSMVGQRMHQESVAREERLQRLRDARVQDFAAKSVHGKVSPNGGAPRTDRLYKEAERRREAQLRQEKKRQEVEQARLAAQPKKKAIQGKARSDRLYKDATRRIEMQREAQQRRESEERERLQQQSVHFDLVQHKSNKASPKLADVVTTQRPRAKKKKNPLSAPKRDSERKQATLQEQRQDLQTENLSPPSIASLEWSPPSVMPAEFPEFCEDGKVGLLELLKTGMEVVEWERGLAKIGPENIHQFVEALQSSRLRKLALHGMGLHCHEVKMLLEAVHTHGSLQHVDLSGNDLGIEGSYALAKTLQANSVLQRLSMRGNCLCTDAVMAITQALKTSSGIRSIDLSMTCLGIHEAAMLAEVLRENKVLQELHVNDNDIPDKGAVLLADGLTCNNALLILNASGNSFHAEGGQAFGDALKRNNTLQRLTLAGNELGIEGGKAIGDGISFNSGLRYLDLAGNMIQAEGCDKISDALKHNTSLLHLDLCFNCIEKEGAQGLSTAIVSNSTLEHLDVAWNLIGNAGAAYFANALEENVSLQRLSLIGNHLEEIAGEALLGSLQANNSIDCLELEGNDICPSDARKIEELLRVNRRLSEQRYPFLESILDEFW